MNVVKENQFKLQDEIGELEEYKQEKYNIEERKNNLNKKIQENQQELEELKKVNKIYEEQVLEKQKLELNQNLVKSYEEKIKSLEEQSDAIEAKNEGMLSFIKESKKREIKENNRKIKIKKIIALILFLVSIIIGIIFIKNLVLAITAFGISLVSMVLLILVSLNKNKKDIKEEVIQQEKATQRLQLAKSEVEKIKAQIEMLNKAKEEKIIEIEKQKQKINSDIEKEQVKLNERYKIKNIELNNNISNEIERIQEELNKNKLELHSLELDKNNIMPKLEKLASMEEELQELNEREIVLNEQNSAIELAKEVLDIAYTKMKENVTPKFTQNLSKNIEEISEGKYKKVKINDEEGIIVEKQNGEYISAQKLSLGTIEQLYLSLRFGAVKELSEESMPIILDEAFAYYDEHRLRNVLKYINEKYKNNQIIIFTCTNREIEILDKENIKYNLISI